MNIDLNARQYRNIQALINYALEHIPDEELTEEMLFDATQYNAYGIFCSELDNNEE